MTPSKAPIDVDALIRGIREELHPAATLASTPDGPPAPSVDEILRRVRHEITLRRGSREAGPGDAVVAPAGPELPAWRAAADRLPKDRDYVLGDFLALDDADFVDAAYRALLRRPPDENGFRYHLDALRSTALSKVDVLAALRWSDEGEARGVHVDGLLLPSLLHRWQRKAVIGPMIRWAHAWLRLPALFSRQAGENVRLARETHELGRHVNEMAALVDARFAALGDVCHALVTRLSSVEERLAATESKLESAEGDLLRVHQRMALAESRADESEAEQVRMRSGLATVQEQLSRAEAGLAEQRHLLQEQLSRAEAGLAEQQRLLQEQQSRAEASQAEQRRLLQEQLSRAEAGLAEQVAELDAALKALHAIRDEAASHAHDLDDLYARFEEQFRGSEALVRERVGQFLPNVRALGPLARVVDLGCGRGEWLQLMKEHGVRAIGVDTNRVFLEQCRNRGLDVVERDAVTWLQEQPAMSVSGITSLHLVEHLPFEALMALLSEAFRTIVPGGLLLLETPNPENLFVSTHGFYMDPTHRNPLPPDMLAWLVQAQGFEAVQIERLTLARPIDAPPLLATDATGADSLNPLLQRLHAAPDYAIVARRP